MSHRVAAIALLAALTTVLESAPTHAQANGQIPSPKTADTPRTPDGHPDLQGYWANTTMTTLERPAELADKAFFTEQEARDWELGVNERRQRLGLTDVEARISPDFTDTWAEGRKVVPSLRTSLIVDPANGKLPPLVVARPPQPEAPRSFENPEELTNSERCLVWTEVPPLVPSGITGNLQIVQAGGYVAIVSEMIHDARIVPLDQRPHLPATIRRWTGDSRGRWDGDTLVVDTTNFTDKTKFRGSTDKLHVVERFTLVDAATIAYQFTVDDSATWTTPWTAESVFTRRNGPLFEYACHEGDYSMRNILAGARAQEKAATEKNP